MPGSQSTSPRILVIRGGAIGDFVLTLPAIALLRENFPAAQIEILGYKHIIELARDRYYAHATRSIEYAALSSFFVPGGDLPGDLVEYFGGFQHVVSYLYDPDFYFETNIRRCGVKNFLAATPKIDESIHAARQLAKPLERLALFLEEPGARLYTSDADREFAAQFLKETPTPVIAMHPGSGSTRKNWPVKYWRELGISLAAMPSAPALLLVGGEADRDSLAFLIKEWNGLPVYTARDLPLPHLAAILEQCAVFIGHDSGISHIAAAVGVPAVLIFGGTNPKIWAPANSNAHVLQASEDSLDRLAPVTVEAAVRGILSTRSL